MSKSSRRRQRVLAQTSNGDSSREPMKTAPSPLEKDSQIERTTERTFYYIALLGAIGGAFTNNLQIALPLFLVFILNWVRELRPR